MKIETLNDLHTKLGNWKSNNGVETETRRWLSTVSHLATYYPKGAGEMNSPRLYWRGQSQLWRMEPGIHTRIRRSQPNVKYPNNSILFATKDMISSARKLGMPGHPASVSALPDLHLLAFMQHQQFSTPLLDFSADFLTALAMACFDEHEDGKDGVLIAYNFCPNENNQINPFETREFEKVFSGYDETRLEPDGSLNDEEVKIFNAPYVTPRQRIQRGVFFTGPMVGLEENKNSSIPMEFDEVTDKVRDFYNQNVIKGARGRRHFPIGENRAAAFIIPRKFKKGLRSWLRQRHLLDSDYVYPEAMSAQLHIEFLNANRRFSPLANTQ